MTTEELQDEDVGRLLRGAAETFIPSAKTKEIVLQQLMKQTSAAVDAPVTEFPPGSTTPKRFTRGLVVSASLAAAVVLTIGIALMALSQKLAASEALDKVVRSSDEYPGWVTVTVTENSGETIISHWNWAKKVTAVVWRQGDQFRAEFASRASGKRFSYESQVQELRVSELRLQNFMPSDRAKQKFTVSSFLDRMQFDAAGVELHVSQRQEGESLSFELSVPREKVSPRAIHKMTILADGRTRLVKRFRMHTDTETVNVSMSYVDPEILSVYDLGVPRNAKIAEVQHEEIETLLDALDKREAERFGDSVVLVTETTQFPGGRKSLRRKLWMMLSKEEAFYYACYQVGGARHSRQGVRPEYMIVPVLDGWPRPSWSTAEGVLRLNAPSWYLVSDGIEMTHGTFQIDGEHLDKGPVRKLLWMRTNTYLGRDLWPCRENMYLIEDNPARGRVELLSHPHRNVVGLRVWESVVGHGLREHVWWFDRERNYVPIERTSQIDHVIDETRTTQTNHVRYVDYERLPNGTWYVSRWEKPNRDHEGRLLSTVLYQMQVFPKTDLGRDLFSSPHKRLRPLIDANRDTSSP